MMYIGRILGSSRSVSRIPSVSCRKDKKEATPSGAVQGANATARRTRDSLFRRPVWLRAGVVEIFVVVVFYLAVVHRLFELQVGKGAISNKHGM